MIVKDKEKFKNFMFREGSVISQAYNPKLFNKKTIEYEIGGEKVSKTIYVKNNISIKEIEAKSKKTDGKLIGPFTITYSDGSTEEKDTQKEFLEKLDESNIPNWYKKIGKSYDKIEEYSSSYDDKGNLLGLYPESYSFYLKLSELAKNSEEFEKIKNDSRMAYHFLFKFGEDKAKAQDLIGRLKQDNKIEKEKLNGKIKRLEHEKESLFVEKKKASDRIQQLKKSNAELENLLVEANLSKIKDKGFIETLKINKKKVEAKLNEAYEKIENINKKIIENEEKINNLIDEKDRIKRELAEAHKDKKKILKRSIAAIAIIAVATGIAIKILSNANQEKDGIIAEKTEVINNQLQNEDWAEFKNSLEEKLGGKILLYADDEGMAGSMRVYFEKDGNLCMKSYKLPEGINNFDGFNKVSLEQFKNDINSDKVEVFDEFSFSKTQKREISVDGVTYNLNGMTNAYGLVKYLLPQNEGESDADYIARCNEVLAAVPSLIIEDQYDDNQKLIGKKVILDAFVAESPDEINDAERIQKEKYYSEAEVASMSTADLIAKTLEEGSFVELENSNGYNFLPRLTIVSATNDIKYSIKVYDEEEKEKLNEELQSAKIIKNGESVVSKVAESGDIKYLRITDLADRDCLYAVKYINNKPVVINNKPVVEKYISLNNYTTDANARDVLMYSLTGNFFDRFGSEDKTMYVKSIISTNSSNEYNGKLDIVCVGYSSDNPIAMEKKVLVDVTSNDKLNIQKLVDVVIARINNDNCPVKGNIEYSLTGAQAIKNEEELVEIDGQVMTSKELTNSLIDEGLIQYK